MSVAVSVTCKNQVRATSETVDRARSVVSIDLGVMLPLRWVVYKHNGWFGLSKNLWLKQLSFGHELQERKPDPELAAISAVSAPPRGIENHKANIVKLTYANEM